MSRCFPCEHRHCEYTLSLQVLSAVQHFEAAQAALQSDDFKTAIKHFQMASDAEPQARHPLTCLPRPPPAPFLAKISAMRQSRAQGGHLGQQQVLPLQNVEYLDALGAVHAEVGQQKEAIKVLQRAVQLEPERGFTKYM